ncbi:MAG: 4-hydroxy-tetrahydrodipicolinate reductase [Omnitrophica WOR_2 bacterium RIFCSPHIGHO2_01_FULL_48_9]|nr:MAG: 4-hydroxy-tetrahydrodipicolinate reductase [Omnitrophica WOR_2 bacterium RIFCSPHIGHO2_02_FULL_48_11]OGX31948.1 MAG: 4-hydroxy-tetrahydrodipicolinate reductase [Omnitrophica WOR_2 bacterium RIFCSPHIGHO2_01_FULL_48_9]
MVKLVISGCYGRMGQRITHLACEDKVFQIAALLENPNHPSINEEFHGVKINSDANAIKGSDVLIEFTTPEATLENLRACVRNKVNMVIGTTGLLPEQIAEIEKASKKIAVVFSSNMSVGVNILFGLAKEAAAKAGPQYKVKIIEAHHIHKKDKPSGTAKTLAEFVQQGSGVPVTDIDSIREGEIIGDHEVILESPEDTIKIYHSAKTRDIFAKGALVAAKFLAKKEKGLFNMQDVLGLK